MSHELLSPRRARRYIAITSQCPPIRAVAGSAACYITVQEARVANQRLMPQYGVEGAGSATRDNDLPPSSSPNRASCPFPEGLSIYCQVLHP